MGWKYELRFVAVDFRRSANWNSMDLEANCNSPLPGQPGSDRGFDFHGEHTLGNGLGERDLVLLAKGSSGSTVYQSTGRGIGFLCHFWAAGGDAGFGPASSAMVIDLAFLRHFTYLFMEIYIIGGVAFVLWIFHFRYLWSLRYRILFGVLIVTVYALPMDALAVRKSWGGFNPAYITGIIFFGGALHLEEVIFWLGTSFVTLSAVVLFAELEDQGVPWWALPAAVILPISLMVSIFPNELDRD